MTQKNTCAFDGRPYCRNTGRWPRTMGEVEIFCGCGSVENPLDSEKPVILGTIFGGKSVFSENFALGGKGGFEAAEALQCEPRSAASATLRKAHEMNPARRRPLASMFRDVILNPE